MSKNNVYRKIPLQIYADICPVCDSHIKKRKEIKFIAHKKRGVNQEFSAQLPYCEWCDLPSSFGDINKALNKEGFSIGLIAIKRNENSDEARNLILDDSKKNRGGFYKLIPNRFIVEKAVIPLRPSGLFSLYEDNSENEKDPDQCIENYNEILADCTISWMDWHNKHECPTCKGNMHNQTLYLSINEKYSLIVYGNKCDKCNVVYVSNTRQITDLLRRNSGSEGRIVCIDGQQYRCFDDKFRRAYRQVYQEFEKDLEDRKEKEKQQERLRSKSAVMSITVTFGNHNYEEYFIVNNSQLEDVSSNGIYYESDFGLELLTAACVQKRNGVGVYKGKEFTVIDTIYGQDEDFKDYLVLDDINIRNDGGYASSVKNSWQSMVHVLMFSPFTNRLEVWRATLDKDDHECYMDMFLFRKFVNKYGNPGIRFNFIYKNRSYHSDFGDLNPESILKIMGYTVASKEGLSARQRRELLMDIVDLKILTIHKIVSYLDMFIKMHPQDSNYDAREKWHEDKTFIEDYKANPQRFYIVQ